jgi:predicted esterase
VKLIPLARGEEGAGFVLLSGVGAVPAAAQLEGARVLVVTGRADPRFPFSYFVAQTNALQRAGASVDALSLPATHALVFTHAKEWIGHFEEWSVAQHE